MSRPKPTVREDLTVVEIDGEVLIYDEGSGSLHHLNATAGIVFGLCDGTRSPTGIAGDIAEAYGLEARPVERQVRTLLRSFSEAGLLRTAAPVPHARA